MLRLFPLILFISGAIDSIRNLPTTALFGSTLIFFFIVAAIFFLIPVALVSANLSSKWTHKGGVYFWVSKAMGERMGFVAIWLQWINTMVWYPTMLSFIAGILAYLIYPGLAQEKLYLVSVILVVFWALTLINLRGIHISARFAAICSFIGMVVPMVIIMVLGLIWLIQGHPLAIHITAHNIFPSVTHAQSWISLTAIMAAYLGMELATVHVSHVKNAQRTFPIALFSSVALILVTMILGSLAIAFVLPKAHISLVTGVMQAFEYFFKAYHMHWLIPVMALMIFVGSLGSMINWIISPAKGLMQAAQMGFMPAFFKKVNRFGASQNILIAQAMLVSVICLVFLLVPSVNGSYWFLTDLSTELYLLMYLFMFIAAIILKWKFERVEGAFVIPGGKAGMLITCLFGMFGTLLALVIGFVPPGSIDVGSHMHYVVMFSLGLLVMCSPILVFLRYHKKHQ